MIQHSRPTIRKKDLESALKVMISDKLATGDIIYEFERFFASYFDKSYSATFVNSGTASLYLILRSMGIEEGDEIILSSFLNASPLQVINQLKAKPVLIDVIEDSYQMDMDAAIAAITDKTKCIIVSHMFGNAALIDELVDIKIPIIEDASHALGAIYRDKKIGQFSDYAYYSLSATRMITSGGAGGMIITKKKGMDAIKDKRHYDKKDDISERFNFYPTDLQASIGMEEMNHLDRMLKVRGDIASFYDSVVMECTLSKPVLHDAETPSNYRYVCKVTGKMNIHEIIDMFARHGVEVCRPVYKPLHQYLGLDKNEYPHTEDAYLTSISIPIYPTLLKDDATLITKLMKQIR